jgi:hypothetical protein
MQPPQPLHIASAVALIAAMMLVSACDKTETDVDVEVNPPALAKEGPSLTMSQWRRAVNGICDAAVREVKQASATLTKQLVSDPASFTEEEVSRGAYEVSRPVIMEHLHLLATLRPPSEFEDDYQRYIATLAQELELSGRIAHLLGSDGAEDELLEADAGLAAAADYATSFARKAHLESCVGRHTPVG